MAILVALDEGEHQAPNVDSPTPHLMAVVPTQCLLVLGQAEKGNITRFIELIHGILEGCLGSLLILRPDPWLHS